MTGPDGPLHAAIPGQSAGGNPLRTGGDARPEGHDYAPAPRLIVAARSLAGLAVREAEVADIRDHFGVHGLNGSTAPCGLVAMYDAGRPVGSFDETRGIENVLTAFTRLMTGGNIGQTIVAL